MWRDIHLLNSIQRGATPERFKLMRSTLPALLGTILEVDLGVEPIDCVIYAALRRIASL